MKGTLTLDGPLTPSSTDSGLELFQASENFSGRGEGYINYSDVVDFEHLAPVQEVEDDEPIEDEPPIDPNDPDASAKRKARREKQREKFLAAKAKREQRKLEQQKKIRQDGDPILYTTRAPEEGWYRMCIQATWYQVGIAHCFVWEPWFRFTFQ